MATTYDKASLVLIPSGTKEGVLFSQKPTNGDGDFTFSRSTSATRVGPSGYIEKETQNLLLQSNTFDTTWTKSASITVTSGQSGYDGTNDAWLLTKTATGFANFKQDISHSGVHTFSVYAKQGTNTSMILRSLGGTDAYSYFDLSLGTITSNSNIIDSNIESVGNGFYRCSITYNASSNTAIVIYPDTPFAGTSAGYIYIQDAQLNQGLVADPYLETTTAAVYGGITDNIPRLDYTDASCPSLLLEPQRTNLITHSEYINASSWNGLNITIVDNYATSPEGFINASLMYPNSSGTFRRLSDLVNTYGVTDTFSFYAKASGFRYISTPNLVGNVAVVGVTFDLQDGVVAYTKSGEGITAEMIDMGDGWYRCIVGSDGTGIQRAYILLSDSSGSTTATANGTDGVLLYGFQVEESSYATSYIPTYGTSVTFASDAASKTGVSDLIGQTEGTLFVEVDTAVLGDVFSGTSRRLLTISDGTTTNRINIQSQSFSDDSIVLQVTNAGAIQALISSSANQSGIKKIAVGYANNDFVMYINGVEIGTDTSGSVPACNRVGVGSFETSANTANSACPVSQALLFKTRLSNEELEALTQV